MRNLLLNIGYDGADYHGWQVQKNAVTVQEVFQNAVEKVFGARLPVKGCSRTDSGVHANCYFVSFQTELSIACDGVVRALNTVLPKDIAVLDCREVPLDFHPRYCCREKEYVYKLYNGAIRDPFLLRYAYQYRYPIRLERMQQGQGVPGHPRFSRLLQCTQRCGGHSAHHNRLYRRAARGYGTV